jgi:HAD superfamily hydrolase (TIGR01509 family)
MDDLTQRKRTLVLWDVGAVLVKLTYDRFYKRGAELCNQYAMQSMITQDMKTKTPEMFKQEFAASGIEEQQVRGRLSTDEFLAELGKMFSPKERMIISPEMVYYHKKESALELVMNCWGDSIDENITIKRRVHEAGYSVGIISNMSQLGWIVLSAKNPEMFNVYDNHGPVILSYRVGLLKPEERMYNILAGMFDQTIFIDDKLAYLEYPIKRLGWHGIWYTEHIDPAETMRLVQKTEENLEEHTRLRKAENTDQLVMALNEFNIKV